MCLLLSHEDFCQTYEATKTQTCFNNLAFSSGVKDSKDLFNSAMSSELLNPGTMISDILLYLL